jgi:putative SOS response-associated peptidase YedK
MCGRFYVSEAELDDFAALVEGIEKDLLKPRPNPDGTADLVPGDVAPVIVGASFTDAAWQRHDPAPAFITGPLSFWQSPLAYTQVRLLTWGFPGPGGKRPVINARAETVMEKPMFKLPFQGHRCLIPASGFYEWADTDADTDVDADALGQPGGMPPRRQGTATRETMEDAPVQLALPFMAPAAETAATGRKNAGRRIRYRFSSRDGRPLALGGIFWTFRLDTAVERTCFTILTVAANDDVAATHDRMPLLLPQAAFADWLRPGVSDRVRALLRPVPANTLLREKA